MIRSWSMHVLSATLLAGITAVAPAPAHAQAPAKAGSFEYRVLATNKTSTMEKEMNEAAGAGFRYSAVMGGETSFGGSEVVTVMERAPGKAAAKYDYRLLATNKTGTMQKELQEAADAGFSYVGQSVFKSTFGGKEVVCILERDRDAAPVRYEYRLLATKKTGTMQKELDDAGLAGFEIVGLTVAETTMGGSELVTITRRALAGASSRK